MTWNDDTGATRPVEQRLHRYPGCEGHVLRWFIIGDVVPMPYRTEQEAMQAWQARQDERRKG